MTRSEKIRLIRALVRGAINPSEILETEVEVWIQETGKESYRNAKTGDIANRDILDKRNKANTKIIRMDYVQGKKIL
jgi:hypothetical protein